MVLYVNVNVNVNINVFVIKILKHEYFYMKIGHTKVSDMNTLVDSL